MTSSPGDSGSLKLHVTLEDYLPDEYGLELMSMSISFVFVYLFSLFRIAA